MNTISEKTNSLINSTSPYLLQHAYNPVDWYEWSNEALDKAKREDKPILVSIGYSSCHWCHVMERECFEKDDIANVMNQYFVCIKVDREERPDVDQVYMEAVQALGTNGGWPLNVFLTPDQKPFYGGTYFPPQNWVQLLKNIHLAYISRRQEIEESAEQLKEHLSRNDTERFKQKATNNELAHDLESIYKNLSLRFDKVRGGLDKAPKFIMPSVWHWLLRYDYLTKNEGALKQTLLTLTEIVKGGIYDQIGGGFARYSVDGEWFAPHFEKMLYDNGQLMSLYAEAYAITKDITLKKVIEETFEWLLREMTSSEGGFYSALDADSEGVEGKFYSWTKDELTEILGKDSELVREYYGVEENGNWEHGMNILHRKNSDADFLKNKNITSEEWDVLLTQIKSKLLQEREKRIRPGLDDKIITSWNAIMICGLTDAYKVTGDEKYLGAAVRNLSFIEQELLEGLTLYRSYKGKRSTVKAFLDDYAYVIQASIKLYQATFNEHWLELGKKLLEETLFRFFDEADGYFNYTSTDSEKLIAEKKEIFDNVIPSSNSIMALNLNQLGILYDNETWKALASQMVLSLSHLITSEPNYMSNWAIAYTEIKKGLAEVAIVGADLDELKKEFQQAYHPFTVVMGKKQTSLLPLLSDKEVVNNTSTIFVCYNKTCKLPVHSVREAITQL